jgi:hypothetical protein
MIIQEARFNLLREPSLDKSSRLGFSELGAHEWRYPSCLAVLTPFGIARQQLLTEWEPQVAIS